MKTLTVKAFINRHHPNQDDECSVTIRVTHDRKKKYYPTKISMKATEFDRIMTAKRRNEADNKRTDTHDARDRCEGALE